jgi:dimethylargininase
MFALTREISGAIARCELTHVARSPIDLEAARRQHEEYERCLSALGCAVLRLDAGDDMADSVFIEDTAVVLDELAVIGRPGAESRRGETTAVATALAPYRTLVRIEAPGTLDGGDVLVAGRRVFVGLSGRTNRGGVDQLARAIEPFGYSVAAVPVCGCLHLKSAVTLVGPRTLLMNPEWIDPARFAPFDATYVDPSEPAAANALWIGHFVVYPSAFALTRQRLEKRGVAVRSIDAGELAKAEGGVTCCSLIFSV